MPFIINPAALDATMAMKLSSFFAAQQQLSISSWHKDVVYQFDDGDEFQFLYDVDSRLRKNGRVGMRYEFFQSELTPLGLGGQSQVYPVQGTLSLQPLRFKTEGSGGWKRGIKIRQHDDKYPDFVSTREYVRSLNAPYLAMKPPTFSADKKRASLVMRLIEGRDLFELINDTLDRTIVLSIAQRFELSVSLLSTLKNRIIDKQLVHRDIKPENIIVNMHENRPIKTDIIDYEFCVSEDAIDHVICGTPTYMAPESFGEKAYYSIKSDIFAMGRILAMIWGIDCPSYDYNHSDPRQFQLLKEHAANIDLSGLFKWVDGLGVEHKYIIQSTLELMMCKEPELRCTIDEAIKSFNKAAELKLDSPRPFMMPR